MAGEKKILDIFVAELKKCGVVGEERAAKLIYLAVTSRFLDKPISIVVKGPSSGGKSFLARSVLRFHPDSAYYALSAMSEKAIAYSDEPLKHRFMVIYEAAGLNSEFQTYLLRSLLSEGEIRYETVEKTASGIEARLIRREGPTGLLLTTTAIQLHPENETRLFSLTVTDTQEQTMEVLKALAEERDGALDCAKWHALQTWIEGGAHLVTIPFAKVLAENIPPKAVRLRRDFAAVLSLIHAHAILHQATRKRDPQGRIIAKVVEDDGTVRDLVADLVAEGVGATVPATVRATVEKVASLALGREVSNSDLAKAMNLDKGTVSRRVKRAIKLGFLQNLETKSGLPARLALGEPMPEEQDILPRVEVLHRCTSNGEVYTPSLSPETSGDNSYEETV